MSDELKNRPSNQMLTICSLSGYRYQGPKGAFSAKNAATRQDRVAISSDASLPMACIFYISPGGVTGNVRFVADGGRPESRSA